MVSKIQHTIPLFFMLLIFFCVALSLLSISASPDESELNSIRNILDKQGASLVIQDLEQKFAERGFQYKKFSNSCSGSTVLKIQGKNIYVLKILTKSEGNYSNEIAISETVGRHSLAPKVLFSGDAQAYCYMVMEFLEGHTLAQVMTWLKIDWDAMNEVIQAVKSLHNSSAYFPPTTTIYENAREYFRLIEKHAIPVPNEYALVRDSFDNLMVALVKSEHYKPCHFDLHGDNIFLTTDRAKFIDWDCAGMGNIYLELAVISLNFRFSHKDDGRMLKTYFPCISGTEEAYFYIAKTLCLGTYGVREFVRPYFSVFPPFSLSKKATQEDYELVSFLNAIRHPKYDDVLTQAREGRPVEYVTDLKIGALMLHEYLQRLKSSEMQYFKYFLRQVATAGRWIMLNHYLYESFLRNFLLSNPPILVIYYNSRK